MLIIIPISFTGCGCDDPKKNYLYRKGDIVTFNINPEIKGDLYNG